MAAPVLAPALISAGAGILGGILANNASSSASEAAIQYQREMLAKLAAIKDPVLKELVIQEIQSQGQLSPQLEQALQQQGTEFDNINRDLAAIRLQQKNANQMDELSDTGITDIDRIAITEGNLKADQAAKARRAQILQNMSERGILGSGMEASAQLQADQAQSSDASAKARDLVKLALERRMNAIGQSSQMAGTMREQTNQEEQARASAADAINRFNTQNSQSVQQRNVGINNLAQERNLAERQRLHEANIAQRLDKQRYDRDNELSRFDAAYKKAGGQGTYANNMSNQAIAAGRAEAQGIGNIVSGVGQGIGAIYSHMAGKEDDDNTNTGAYAGGLRPQG